MSTEVPERRASFAEFLPYLRGHVSLLVAAGAVSLVATALALLQPLMVQQLINAVGAGTGWTPFLWLLVAITLGQAVFSAGQSYLLQRTAESVVLGVRRSLVGQLLRLPVREFDARRVGDLMSRVGSDTTLLRSVITSGLFEIVSSVLMFAAAVVLMILLDPLLFGITVTAVLGGAACVVLLGSLIRRRSRQVQEAVGAMAAAVERGLSGIRTIKAAVAEDREAALIDREAVGAYRAGVAAAKLQAVVEPIMSICIQGAFIVVLTVGGVRVADGSLALGDLLAFILYLFLLVLPIGSALGAFVQIQAGLAALDRIQEVARLEPEAGDEDGLAPGRTASTAPEVRFDAVSFGYDDGGEPVLADLSFSVPAGSRTAIVGPSGAGKSTVLGLLERFYEPTGGTITYDGVPLAAIPRRELRSRLGLVEQEAPVLSGTLADNLRISAPDATSARMVSALESVGLGELVERSETGLGLNLGEDGVRLSGGQRQRLAWARVLLADRPVLLMDEPTSAVDSRTEQLLQRTLSGAARSRTVVVVAHRLSTIADFDRILVMDRGRVVASGTHATLVQSSALYRDMAVRQRLVQHA
ncbi:MAG: Efflux ABC transporter, permease/ATP-binding protein SCO3235 [uncultured Arthrobacter sp.]|uniref:Efflux ABC transporter, permease/ATP-binding protein SCO3235 n=1 Tax=uncultured Arthrobacter sp. TaxID=114050 RepID=A0A6J4HUY4_9MICC|nr:ABC transporter ATP-binding protein [uncultured Arthrobacter sp.]CAA9234372.1 MAG: Efflux ABC transporter, permease/ATP-binding protein SCO3235 [uncultured Arthrobacter sp.]